MFDQLSKHKWSSNGRYAYRSVWVKPKCKHIYMHREIMSAQNGFEVDHINHDPLDNRRENLRVCAKRDNNRNRRGNTKTTSRFKGICWLTKFNRWEVKIKKGSKRKYLGRFKKEIEAARAYDEAALEHFGEFAHLNFPKVEVG